MTFSRSILISFIPFAVLSWAQKDPLQGFIETHCVECHDADTKRGSLDLTAIKLDAAGFDTWVKVHDRVRAGEMPPEKKPRPEAGEQEATLKALANELSVMDTARVQRDGRARLRRLNRVEFENSLRDLLAMPALKIKESLPEDGKSLGFDRLAGALDMSFVHMESYLAAVDKALNEAL